MQLFGGREPHALQPRALNGPERTQSVTTTHCDVHQRGDERRHMEENCPQKASFEITPYGLSRPPTVWPECSSFLVVLLYDTNTTRRLTFPSASSLLWTRIDLHATRSFQVLGFLPFLFLVVAGTMKAFHWLSFAVRTPIQLRPGQSAS
ncbi:hypothetical protein CI102_10448 [Trichoderma harzianum]|nr:hypothetical protein CI102_10448 [Trichoderma harzianum]